MAYLFLSNPTIFGDEAVASVGGEIWTKNCLCLYTSSSPSWRERGCTWVSVSAACAFGLLIDALKFALTFLVSTPAIPRPGPKGRGICYWWLEKRDAGAPFTELQLSSPQRMSCRTFTADPIKLKSRAFAGNSRKSHNLPKSGNREVTTEVISPDEAVVVKTERPNYNVRTPKTKSRQKPGAPSFLLLFLIIYKYTELFRHGAKYNVTCEAY